MLILGIDPGSTITACGLINPSTKKAYYDFIKLKKKLKQEEKVFAVYNFIKEILEQHNPTEVAIETPFYSVNIQSAMLLSEIKAAAIIAVKQYGIEVEQYTPRQIKQSICGYGAADKNQVKFVVEKTLKLDLNGQPFDVSDSLAVALTHLYARGL